MKIYKLAKLFSKAKPIFLRLANGNNTKVAIASIALSINVNEELPKIVTAHRNAVAVSSYLPANATLNQALISRGFFGCENTRARRNKVELVRLNNDGTATKRTIEVDLTQGINEELNSQLRNNDMIIVSRSGFANLVDRMNAVIGPVGPDTGVLNFINVLRFLFR